jgi:SAM-dependent methyltransferase
MSRSFLSRPVQQLLADGLLQEGSSFFDFGCGRGGDVRRLRDLGYVAAGWDPAHAPDAPKHKAKIVNLGYVVNVIEDQNERRQALIQAWSLTEEVLVVSARLDWEVASSKGKAFGDGLVTKTGTFQKYYSQGELRAWIDAVTGFRSVAAAPGIFYVFRSSAAEQRLLAHHAREGHSSRLSIAELVYGQHRDLLAPLEQWVDEHRSLPTPADLPNSNELIATFDSIRSAFALVRRVSDSSRWVGVNLGNRRSSEVIFEANLELLQPLIDFLSERGRLPHPRELAAEAAINERFGSIRRAFSLVRRVTGSERWIELETRSSQDFLVYLALAAFVGRPKFGELPEDLQHDARDFFGSYKEACSQADKLLFGAGNQEALELACRTAPFGKLTPEALYVHVAGLSQLPSLLRVYAGCSETLTGRVDDATLLKIHRLKPQVSFLLYPTFDTDPHPPLSASIVGRLHDYSVSYKDFSQRENPPILHRKEVLVPFDYPGREKFERLTLQEERAGLLSDPGIGTREGWNKALSSSGYALRGHRLIHSKGTASVVPPENQS